ncbi:hypothetical protein [Hymenobacter sp. APR13]|uniref:hypothetical protein n=1 Tax=Hymenobacter sp. APR13 TaxID=1356852 RepID=UPI0012E06079|nr:hypothetical protein [Hymenobacter sp. APR13]
MSIKIKGLLLLGFLAGFLVLQVSSSSSSRTHVQQGQLELQKLEAANVTSVTLAPFPSRPSIVNKAVVIKDSTFINTLVRYYKGLSKYRIGQGRIPGDWEVEVVFSFADGKKLSSHIYHNEYATLTFIPTTEKNAFGGYDDLFADNPQHDIGRLLENYR